MNCHICYTSVKIFTTSCGHSACNLCFQNFFNADSSYPIECFSCGEVLPDKDCEIFLSGGNKEIWKQKRKVWLDIFDKTLHKCLNPKCDGEIRNCEATELRRFACPKCKLITCIKCKATHNSSQKCKDWRKKNVALFEEREKQNRLIQSNINKRNAMYCVVCGLYVERNEGCYGMKCGLCKTRLCLITQKSRWGPKGKGDYSDGCGCKPSAPCHKDCNSCNIDNIDNDDVDDDYYYPYDDYSSYEDSESDDY